MIRKKEYTTQEIIDTLNQGVPIKGRFRRKIIECIENLRDANKKLWSER